MNRIELEQLDALVRIAMEHAVLTDLEKRFVAHMNLQREQRMSPGQLAWFQRLVNRHCTAAVAHG